ncbi:MAG: hypothetical protein R3A44_24635 [Caldilineaceae bacterium]
MALFVFGNSTIEIADAANRADDLFQRGTNYQSATRTITSTYQEKPQTSRQEIGITILVECAAAHPHAASALQFVLDTLQTALSQRATGSLRQHLRNALHYAHEQMLHSGSQHSDTDAAQISVTLAAIVEDRLYISRAGAQRAYLFDGQTMRSITPEPTSETPAEMSYLGGPGALRIVDRMLLPVANADQMVANRPDADYLVLQPETIILLCAGAISNIMSPHVMGTIVAESLANYVPPIVADDDENAAGDLAEAARRLTAWAETDCAAVLFRRRYSAAQVSTPSKWSKSTSVLIVVLLIVSVTSLSFTLRQIWTLYWGDAIAEQSQVSLGDLAALAATATALVVDAQTESSPDSQVALMPIEPAVNSTNLESNGESNAEAAPGLAITVVSVAAAPTLPAPTAAVTDTQNANMALTISDTVTNSLLAAATPTLSPTATPHLAQTATAWKRQQETRVTGLVFATPVLPPTVETPIASTNTPQPTSILNGLTTPNLSQTAAARALVLATNIAATRTAEPTATARPSATPTFASAPTGTDTATPAPTATRTATATASATSTPTNTAMPTATPTATSSATATATLTATATATSTAPATATPPPTATATATPTATPSATPTTPHAGAQSHRRRCFTGHSPGGRAGHQRRGHHYRCRHANADGHPYGHVDAHPYTVPHADAHGHAYTDAGSFAGPRLDWRRRFAGLYPVGGTGYPRCRHLLRTRDAHFYGDCHAYAHIYTHGNRHAHTDVHIHSDAHLYTHGHRNTSTAYGGLPVFANTNGSRRRMANPGRRGHPYVDAILGSK